VWSEQGREGHKRLLRELNEERAAALRRISSTLESLIYQLYAACERVRQAAGAERDREIAGLRDLRARALKYRWYLEVQREALGLRSHEALDEFYKVPAIEAAIAGAADEGPVRR
jgi:hypothetical protein